MIKVFALRFCNVGYTFAFRLIDQLLYLLNKFFLLLSGKKIDLRKLTPILRELRLRYILYPDAQKRNLQDILKLFCKV